jgi:membrane protein YqaA with SNARE-associated domain
MAIATCPTPPTETERPGPPSADLNLGPVPSLYPGEEDLPAHAPSTTDRPGQPQSADEGRRPVPRWVSALSVLASLLLMVAAVPLGPFLSTQFQDLAGAAGLGLPLLFLTQAVTSATIFLPLPGAAAVMIAGSFWDPLWVGVVAGLGSATGELTGYALGYHGRRVVRSDGGRRWSLAERGFRRWGMATLFLMSVIPNPLLDGVGILAGSLRYPLLRFWLATAAGKILKMAALAALGGVIAAWGGFGPFGDLGHFGGFLP